MPPSKTPLRHRDWIRVWPIPAVAIAVVILAAAGMLPTWSGLVYLVAVPPLDVFADLRVLLVTTSSWPAFIVLVILSMTLRVTILAHLLGGLDRRRLRFAITFYTLSAVPAIVAAQLSYTAYAALYVRTFWAAVWITVLTFLLLAAAPWDSARRPAAAVINGVRSYRRIGMLVGYLVVVAALGGLAETFPGLTYALVLLTSVITGAVIVVLPRLSTSRSLLWPLPVVTVVVAGFLASWGADRVFVADPAPAPREGSLMLMSGINSSSGDGAIYQVDPGSFGFTCEQVYYYSYAGPGDGVPEADGRCPIRTGAAFEGTDTHRPMSQLAEDLVAQVAGLPRPVSVIGHSHSAWVAWLAASSHPDVAIDNLIVLSAFPESGHGYTDAHATAPGRVAGDLLRITAPVAKELGFVLPLGTPAIDRMLGDPDGPADIMRRPLPGHVQGMSVMAATDQVLLPRGWEIGDDVDNPCPVWISHPMLPLSDVVAHEINRFFDGGDSGECRPAAASVLAAVSRPLGVPRHDQVTAAHPRAAGHSGYPAVLPMAHGERQIPMR